jgi:hypothetical protein
MFGLIYQVKGIKCDRIGFTHIKSKVTYVPCASGEDPACQLQAENANQGVSSTGS